MTSRLRKLACTARSACAALIVCTASACSGDAADSHDAHAAIGHVHVAPNGGKLVELGTHEANLELVYDASSGLVRLHVLDAHAEHYARLATAELVLDVQAPTAGELRLIAVANALSGETVGDTARFEGTLAARPAQWSARLRAIDVRGTHYSDVEVRYP